MRRVLYAAVVIPIVLNGAPELVLVRRASHLRRNPGQAAFPGGLVDPADVDERATALREFEEELGVPRERLRVADRFGQVVTLSRTVTITPYLAFLDGPVDFTADEREIESVHRVPLAALYVRNALREGYEPTTRDGRPVEVATWIFDYGDLHVWGATARILHGFTARYATASAVLAMR